MHVYVCLYIYCECIYIYVYVYLQLEFYKAAYLSIFAGFQDNLIRAIIISFILLDTFVHFFSGPNFLFLLI